MTGENLNDWHTWLGKTSITDIHDSGENFNDCDIYDNGENPQWLWHIWLGKTSMTVTYMTGENLNDYDIHAPKTGIHDSGEYLNNWYQWE